MNFIAIIVGLAEILCLSSPVTAGEDKKSNSSIAPKINDFKLNLHRILEGTRVRKKRQTTMPNGPPSHQMRVGSSSPETLQYLSDYSLTFWIPVEHMSRRQVLVGTEEGHLMLFELSETDDRIGRMVALAANEVVAYKAVAFSHYDEQWFAIIQSSDSKIWIRLYLRVGRGLEGRQTIVLFGETDFNLLTVKGVHYLTVATYRNQSNQVGLFLYHWTKTQFDVISSRTMYGARSVTTWVMDGSLYFAVAQELNEEGNFHVGSPIFLFNAKDNKKLVLLEVLATYGPKKVLNFFVSGSQYVIFIGREDAVIYWWSSNQFLFWQKIQGTAYASDVSVLALENGEVVIVIVLKEEALFLTLDISGHYYVSFTMLLSGFDLKSLQFMYSGKAYYALALSTVALAHRPQPVWKLTLDPYITPSRTTLEPLHQCLNELADNLDKHQAAMNQVHSDLGRVWLTNKNQTVTADVFVTNEMTSPKPSSITEIIIVTTRKILPDTSLSLVAEAITRMEALVTGIQQNIKNSVLKSARQEIKGNKHFHDSIVIPSLTMESINTDVPINYVSVSRIHDYALRKVGNQTFHHPANVGNVHGQQFTTLFLNGVLVEDLLPLLGTQEITGSLKFTDILATDMTVQDINTISIDNFVTTYSEQLLRDLKHISALQASLVSVQGQTNGEDLKEFYSKIITLNEDKELKGRYDIESQVYVYGDIFLRGVLNGRISVSELVANTVRKSEDQDLNGYLTFTSPVHILGDMNTAALINGINIADLVTLSSNQIIHSDIIFYELLTIQRDLVVDLVNGFDLDKTAALRTTDPQFILGFKTFRDRLLVDFIEMTDFVTLDGVDPSLLVQDIVKHKEGVVTSNDTVFHNVVVLGNVTAVEGVNGHKVFDLPEIVWLKSMPQAIVVPVNINEISVKDLEVTTVNNYFIDKDVVFTFTDETIVSFKTFVHNVSVVNNVNTVIGSQINGFDVITFKEEMDKYEKEGTIWGKKHLQNLEVYGDVDVENFNDLPLQNIMRPYAYQEVLAQVQFFSELTLIKDNLKTTNVRFNKFNSNDLPDLRAIPTKVSQEAVKNKAFSIIKAEHVVMQEGAMLNGINFLTMMGRIATLNTPQEIQSEKVFLYPTHMHRASTDTLNGRELSTMVSNVVLTDAVSNVNSPKSFTGTVQADNVVIRGYVNGIDFDLLNRNVFYKSRDNQVKPHMEFQSGIFVGKLLSGSLLDGMKWDDLIFIDQDEVLDHVRFLFYTILNGHLAVGGLLNGCDLFQLGQRALYANKSVQLIREEVTIQSIEILGNLNLKNVVNEIPIEELQRNFITIYGDQAITSNVQLGHGFVVKNLNLGDKTNHVSIPFILSDAVRHSIPQAIGGYKHFRDMRATILAASVALVVESLDGIDVNKIYENAVWKHGSQVIEGEKIFNFLRADVATIDGYINGMRLPYDAVLTYTTDHIMGPTFITSDLVMVSDVFVDGRIDGVLLPALLEGRVTLAGEDLVKSRLIFRQDVTSYGELIVGGTINNLVLELVCRVNRQIPLEGYKVFVRNVHVLGSVSASSINGHDVQKLDRNTLRHDGEEFITELQLFEKPPRAHSSLYTGWINNISISGMASTYFSIMHNIHQTLGYFDDLAYGYYSQITRQIEAATGKISSLAYLILVQEINIGPATKILHGYRLEHVSSEFSHSMVLWTSRKQCTYLERCCHVEFSNWMRVKKTGHLMVDSSADEGRVYPIHNPAPVIVDKEFVVWTNTTQVQPKWCGKSYDETMSLSSVTASGSFQAFMYIRNAPLLSEVKSFRQGHLYVVAGFFYDKLEDEYSSSVVYVFNEVKREWNEFQILPSFGVLSLDITYFSDGDAKELLLAIGTGTGTFSSVYKWNDLEHGFELLRNIPSTYVTSTLWLKQGSNQLLAMASVDHWPKRGEDCLEFLSGGQINIYTYKTRELKWIQSIPLKGVVSMVTFDLEGDTFLVAASHQLQTIYIYEWKGYAGFSQTQTIFVGEVRHLNTYTIGDVRYLTVAVTSGPSKLLKVVVQGRHTLTSARRRDPSLQEDQKDEASLEDLLVPAC